MSNLILSFDVGIIHLSYCLLQKDNNNQWEILEWNNINLSLNNNFLCNECNNKAHYTNNINNIQNYYCKIHAKNITYNIDSFENLFKINNTNNCCYDLKSNNKCNKKSKFCYNYNNYCNLHSKLLYKNINKKCELKEIKFKSVNKLIFDDLKFNLITELENRPSLLQAKYVVIENQPSFKNPRMKSIASTLYDYYLIRGIIDKPKNNLSNIISVKFISPSNKLKLLSDNDNKELKKIKSINESKSYKLTKNLAIKYCNDLIQHLDFWKSFFNNNKKKDDLADSFLQGIYFYNKIKK